MVFLIEIGVLFKLEVVFLKDKVMLMLDMIGLSLFKWGYCIEKGGVFFKENMVVVLVMLINWCKDCFFYDLVCGFGIICIEVVLIGYNIVFGFNCSFICEIWDWVDLVIFEKVCNEVEVKVDYDVELDICGLDVDGWMIEVVWVNVEEVGLGDLIIFK